jgi:hypothetical protein
MAILPCFYVIWQGTFTSVGNLDLASVKTLRVWVYKWGVEGFASAFKRCYIVYNLDCCVLPTTVSINWCTDKYVYGEITAYTATISTPSCHLKLSRSEELGRCSFECDTLAGQICNPSLGSPRYCYIPGFQAPSLNKLKSLGASKLSIKGQRPCAFVEMASGDQRLQEYPARR